MELSVVILNYNVRFFLEQCIRSVEKALVGIDAEIIVLDNASSDKSCEMLRETFPHITLMANSENLGFSKANNQGVQKARGAYVCILNPDTALPHDIFRQCLEFAQKHEKMGILGVRLLDGTGNDLPESKRNVPTPSAAISKLLGLSSRGRGYYDRSLDAGQTGPTPVIPGAFMFLRRELYLQVGGLDEDYFMYGEDIDLSYKVLSAGYQNYYLGAQVMLHYKGESTRRNREYYDRFYGAMRIFYNKHFTRNILQRLLVGTAVLVVKMLMTKRQNLKPESPEPEEVVLITDNFQLLQLVSDVFEQPVRSASKVIFDQEKPSGCLFIFDEAYISYNQIFMVMQRLKNRNNLFRIRPGKCRFFIGSDRSDEKGSVTHF